MANIKIKSYYLLIVIVAFIAIAVINGINNKKSNNGRSISTQPLNNSSPTGKIGTFDDKSPTPTKNSEQNLITTPIISLKPTKNNIYPVPTTVPFPEDANVIIDDAPMDVLTSEQENIANLEAKLRSESPVVTDFFTVWFDYKENTFKIKFFNMKTPDENRNKITEWFKAKGYDILPAKDFVFISD